MNDSTKEFSGHTPEPWFPEESHGFINAENGTPIAQVFDNVDDGTRPIDEEESEKNQNLIAAAPRLLRECNEFRTALRELVDVCIDWPHRPEFLKALKKAREVLKP